MKADPAVWYFGGSGGNSSVVECDLAKVEVAGSNPVSRSNLCSADVWSGSSRRRRASVGNPAIDSLALGKRTHAVEPASAGFFIPAARSEGAVAKW